LPQGKAPRASKVIRRRHTGSHILLVDCADIDHRLAVLHLPVSRAHRGRAAGRLDTVSIAVIHKFVRGRARDGDQPILFLPLLREGTGTVGMRGHIPIAVINEGGRSCAQTACSLHRIVVASQCPLTLIK
jgi:hypothetical protein